MAPLSTAHIIRTAVRTRLRDRLLEAVGDDNVPVSYGYPGKKLEREHIWFLSPVGDVDAVLIAGNTTPLEDAFSFTVVCMAGRLGQPDDAAEARAEELLNAVVAALYTGNLAGIDDGRSYVLTVLMGRVDGPHVEFGAEGFVAFASVDVACVTRTSY